MSTSDSTPDSAPAAPTGEDLEALRSRDPEAVRRWIYRHRDYIRSVLRRYSSHSGRVRDLVQEVFFQVLRSLPSFQGDSKITTWLYSISKNVALSRNSTDQRHSFFSEDTLEYLQADANSRKAVPPSPLSRAEQEQKRTLFYEAMEELTSSYREIIRLRDLQERSTKEVAEQLGLTRVNVRVRLHRARTSLREKLAPRLENGQEGA